MRYDKAPRFSFATAFHADVGRLPRGLAKKCSLAALPAARLRFTFPPVTRRAVD